MQYATYEPTNSMEPDSTSRRLATCKKDEAPASESWRGCHHLSAVAISCFLPPGRLREGRTLHDAPHQRQSLLVRSDGFPSSSVSKSTGFRLDLVEFARLNKRQASVDFSCDLFGGNVAAGTRRNADVLDAQPAGGVEPVLREFELCGHGVSKERFQPSLPIRQPSGSACQRGLRPARKSPCSHSSPQVGPAVRSSRAPGLRGWPDRAASRRQSGR